MRRIKALAGVQQLDAVDTLQDAAQTGVPRRKWTRLTGAQRREVVARYSAGEHTTDLAAEFGVAKATVIGILREANVVVRRQPLTLEQVDRAIRLYADGNSLANISESIGAGSETIRRALIAKDVKLRPRPGR